jgi:hypothetical protein
LLVLAATQMFCIHVPIDPHTLVLPKSKKKKELTVGDFVQLLPSAKTILKKACVRDDDVGMFPLLSWEQCCTLIPSVACEARRFEAIANANFDPKKKVTCQNLRGQGYVGTQLSKHYDLLPLSIQRWIVDGRKAMGLAADAEKSVKEGVAMVNKLVLGPPKGSKEIKAGKIHFDVAFSCETFKFHGSEGAPAVDRSFVDRYDKKFTLIMVHMSREEELKVKTHARTHAHTHAVYNLIGLLTHFHLKTAVNILIRIYTRLHLKTAVKILIRFYTRLHLKTAVKNLISLDSIHVYT